MRQNKMTKVLMVVGFAFAIFCAFICIVFFGIAVASIFSVLTGGGLQTWPSVFWGRVNFAKIVHAAIYVAVISALLFADFIRRL